MRDYGLIDIEDFEKAYKERFKDYQKLKRDYKDHPIMLMHLGGVIIECYLKSLIVKKYRIKQRIKRDWYSEDSVRFINESRVNIDKTKFRELKYDKGNPGHDIEEAYKQLEELDSLIASNLELSKKFKRIKNPIGKEFTDFIDLRYEIKDSFEDIDNEFEEWEKDFKDVLNWLKEHSSEVEV
ncbi:hypothetical protein NSA45_04605 [Paraclostridium bifermentans]|uniref:hypothetical protein n=1 Tax=Paraclostridium bifermentans TaxID=1490 RepID=UPI002149EEBA|nr:hypothetical protein [Paraclostridium bifermentans]MCR1875131.1 hypothetical protein [Paraclostridium bifermentans]